MRQILPFIVLALTFETALAADWKECDLKSSSSPENCHALLEELYQKSTKPEEAVLLKDHLLKWSWEGPMVLLAKDKSLFFQNVNSTCQTDRKNCLAGAHSELTKELVKAPDLADLSKLTYEGDEAVFKLKVEKGKSRYLYHVKQNGKFLVGYKEDLNPKVNRRHYFLIDTAE